MSDEFSIEFEEKNKIYTFSKLDMLPNQPPLYAITCTINPKPQVMVTWNFATEPYKKEVSSYKANHFFAKKLLKVKIYGLKTNFGYIFDSLCSLDSLERVRYSQKFSKLLNLILWVSYTAINTIRWRLEFWEGHKNGICSAISKISQFSMKTYLLNIVLHVKVDGKFFKHFQSRFRISVIYFSKFFWEHAKAASFEIFWSFSEFSRTPTEIEKDIFII